MPETDTAIDELLVSESVEAPSAARNGLVVAVALVVILTIAIITTSVLFAPVAESTFLLWFGWMFAGAPALY